ncbi:MAG: hypothetical protein J6386_21715 [Candidatus Synoicihabitans palmerolidicus]|nr:hypothetical protein [Candidatus Synoicihabitans palmerolidicus]
MLTSCAKDEVQAYRVPKEIADPSLTAPASAGSASSGTSDLVWSAPDHWVEKPGSGMRRSSFTLTDADGATADLSIISFPGDVGGLTANINRWRGQISLPPLSEVDAEATIEHIDTPTFHVDFVDYLGTANDVPTRIVGAILHHGDQSVFFKLMGPASLVEAETANFRAFIQTIAPVTP